jgi:hypothetical protein
MAGSLSFTRAQWLNQREEHCHGLRDRRMARPWIDDQHVTPRILAIIVIVLVLHLLSCTSPALTRWPLSMRPTKRFCRPCCFRYGKAAAEPAWAHTGTMMSQDPPRITARLGPIPRAGS